MKDEDASPNVSGPLEERKLALARRSVPNSVAAEEVKAAPTLRLQIVESPTLEKGQEFVINAAGYVRSRRGAKDGCTFIGTAECDEATGECPNDILVPAGEVGMGDVHLVIQYNPEDRGYAIRDYGNGTGTFIKIERPLALKRGYIVSYGDSHMYVNMLTENKIQLKFLDGPKADQML